MMCEVSLGHPQPFVNRWTFYKNLTRTRLWACRGRQSWEQSRHSMSSWIFTLLQEPPWIVTRIGKVFNRGTWSRPQKKERFIKEALLWHHLMNRLCEKEKFLQYKWAGSIKDHTPCGGRLGGLSFVHWPTSILWDVFPVLLSLFLF